MSETNKIIAWSAGIFMVVVAVGIYLSYAIGWIGVHQTKTIGKARENAKREVFEHSQSYVEGKRQEAVKLLKEFNQAKAETDTVAMSGIEYTVSQTFANFDEEKYLTGPVLKFVQDCKYK